MNINDVQNSNKETQKLQGLKNYVAQKSETGNFSYYVEVSKTQETKDKIIQNSLENQEEKQDELLLQTDKQSDNNFSYVQNFQVMNEGLFNLGISEKLFEKRLSKSTYEYNINLAELTLDDIKLFSGLSQKADISVSSINPQNQTFNAVVSAEGLNVSYKSLEVSKTLFSAIENASKTGKPIRLDFGKDASVILKISKDGKVSADFIPNDKAMEIMLRNAIPELKAKFEEEKLPYGELNYKNFNQQKENQKENKEKKDE